MSTDSSTELAPPEEKFWRRYSPRQEFPLASATSLALHGLALGLVLLAGLSLSFRWHGEASQPPASDVVFVAAPLGDGGTGGDGGTPGAPNRGTEITEPTKPTTLAPAAPAAPVKPVIVLKSPVVEDLVPSLTPATEKADAVDQAIQKIEEQFKKDAVSGTNVQAKAGPATAGGQGGKGIPGSGGPGGGGTPGSPTGTRAQILANRWNFDLSGSPKDHVKKAIASGVTLAVMDSNKNLFLVKDLKQRPVSLEPVARDRYKDTVQWFNMRPDSVFGLAQELRLPGPPYCFVLLLPKEREQMLAEAELRFTQERRRDLSKVSKTWFDFRLRAGSFEPFVIGQSPFDRPD